MIGAAIAAAGLMAGCGRSSAPSPGAPVSVTERDFHISAGVGQVRAGTVTLHVDNQGPDQHELIVVPERLGGPPLRSDGLTVNEEALQGSEPGSLEPGAAGAERTLTVHLRPGRYVLFCNMEGHFMAGMHTDLLVTP